MRDGRADRPSTNPAWVGPSLFGYASGRDGVDDASGGHAGEGVVLLQGFAQLDGLGEDELATVPESPAHEAQGTDEGFLRGAGEHVVALEAQGKDAELPRLAAGEQVEGARLDLIGARVDVGGEHGVLLGPGPFDGVGADAEELFGDGAEWAAAEALGLEDLVALVGGEDAGLDQKLAQVRNR